MSLETIGRGLLIVGVIALAFGGLFLLMSRVPGLNQLFNLPGDIRIEGANLSCFVPIVSMILISIVLTVVANVVIRLLNR